VVAFTGLAVLGQHLGGRVDHVGGLGELLGLLVLVGVRFGLLIGRLRRRGGRLRRAARALVLTYSGQWLPFVSGVAGRRRGGSQACGARLRASRNAPYTSHKPRTGARHGFLAAGRTIPGRAAPVEKRCAGGARRRWGAFPRLAGSAISSDQRGMTVSFEA